MPPSTAGGRSPRASRRDHPPPGLWGPGTATGVGSLPGTDPVEATRLVLGELPELPFLPELPGRGAGADLAGRTCALLVDLPVDLQPGGWRLVERPGRDLRRARDTLARDLDALEEAAAGGPPPRVKVQAAGPWTLAALVELRGLDRVLADAGAVRDLAASLAEGLSAHVADVRRRVPGAQVLLQLDEPSLPAVLAGRIPTTSGFGSLRAPDDQAARDLLRAVVDAVDAPVAVHCCASSPPVALLRTAGVSALSLDATLLGPGDDQALGDAVEAGVQLLLGVVPALDAPIGGPDDVLAPVRALWRRLGFAAELLPATVAVTPTCGLAGASAGHARRALQACAKAAYVLVEEPL